MKNISLCLAVLILSACGKAPETAEATRQVDAQLESYVQLFESRLGSQIDFPVTVARTVGLVVGECVRMSDGSRAIHINPYYVVNADKAKVEATVLHELGHCVLGRQHENEMNGAAPASLMYYAAFTAEQIEIYKANKSAFLNELFN